MQATRDKTHELVDQDIEVIAEVDLAANFDGSFELSLIVMIAGVSQKFAERILDAAHAICPYSNAVRGNTNISTSVVIR